MKKLFLTMGAAVMALSAGAAVNMLSEGASTFDNGELNGWYGWGGQSTRTVVEGGYNSEYCLALYNPTVGEDYWTAQAACDVDFKDGDTYRISFYAKSAEEGGSIQFLYQEREGANGTAYTAFDLTTDWAKYEKEFTVSGENYAEARIVFGYGKVVGTFYIDDIVLEDLSSDIEIGDDGVPSNYKLLINGNTADGTKIVEWSAKLENTTYEGTDCIKYENETAGNSYDTQLAIDYDYAADETYYLLFDVLGTPSDASLSAWYQYQVDGNASEQDYSAFPSFKVTSNTEWTAVKLSGKTGGERNRIVINLGEYVGTLYITNIRLYGPSDEVEGPDSGFTAPEGYELVISGNTADGTKIVKWSAKLDNTTYEGTDCIKYENETAGNSYDTQLAVDYEYEAEKTYYLVFDVLGTPSDASLSAWYQYQVNGNASEQDYSAFPSFKVTSDTEWTEVVLSGKPGGERNRIAINLGEYVGTLYFTNIRLYAPESNSVVQVEETILENAPVFNLQGVKVGTAETISNLPKGIYIVNGKKVIR